MHAHTGWFLDKGRILGKPHKLMHPGGMGEPSPTSYESLASLILNCHGGGEEDWNFFALTYHCKTWWRRKYADNNLNAGLRLEDPTAEKIHGGEGIANTAITLFELIKWWLEKTFNKYVIKPIEIDMKSSKYVEKTAQTCLSTWCRCIRVRTSSGLGMGCMLTLKFPKTAFER